MSTSETETPWYHGVNLAVSSMPDLWSIYCKYDGIKHQPFVCATVTVDRRFADLFAAAPGIATERDHLRSEVERLTAQVEALKKADMFWDALDPERPYDYAEEVCQYYRHGVVCEVQRAVALSNAYVATLPAADDAEDDENWVCIADTKEACADAVKVEMDRRAALNGGGHG